MLKHVFHNIVINNIIICESFTEFMVSFCDLVVFKSGKFSNVKKRESEIHTCLHIESKAQQSQKGDSPFILKRTRNH